MIYQLAIVFLSVIFREFGHRCSKKKRVVESYGWQFYLLTNLLGRW